MCSPAALVVGLAGMQMGGAAYSAYQQNQAGKETQKYYNYVAAQNAAAADEAIKQGDREETMIQDAAAYETGKHKRSVRQFAAKQIADAAGNNIGGGSVTTQAIAQDTFDRAKLDELAIRYNADTRGYTAKTEASNKAWDLRNQSTMNRISGVQARKTAARQANATLLGGATQAAGTYANYKLYS